MLKPFISICIPAYRRVVYLQRLLESIKNQTFTDFEVIISDDSPDESVRSLVDRYTGLNIRYFQNSPALGTPANWNSAIRKASGEWIKLIHDDDWLADENSLKAFAERARQHKKFIFSAYSNQIEGTHTAEQRKFFPQSWRNRIIRQPMTLLAYNVIGPPSVIMVHHSVKELYDENLKWRVDMEYYIRLLESLGEYDYIDKILVHVGVSESQVTQSCIYQPSVELPEGKRLLEKHGVWRLKNILVYDAWWRLLRNMGIRTPEQLTEFASGEWPETILRMLKDLSRHPDSRLKNGYFSKAFMFVSYLRNRFSIPKKQ